jgi:iron complex outermembrane receptor protein
MNKHSVMAALCAGSVLGLRVTAAHAAEAEQAAASPPTSVGEIIVTANKREERLQDIPATIQASRGADLTARQITTNDQLMQIIPDLRVGSAYAGLAQDVSIRGIGPANNFNFNVEQPVGLYIDEIYQTLAAAPGTQLFDLARVEVLKGPQGTLYGRNTTGGAINYITEKPLLERGEYDGDIEVGYGNYDRVVAQAATDLTLIDGVLGLRAAIFHSSRDGYIKNVGTMGPSSFASDDTTDGRILIKFKPNIQFDATLGVYVNDFSGSIGGPIDYGVYPGDTILAPLPYGYSRANLTPYQAQLNFFPDNKSSSTDVGLTMNWNAGPIRLTSITSYEHSTASINNDCDGSPLSV